MFDSLLRFYFFFSIFFYFVKPSAVNTIKRKIFKNPDYFAISNDSFHRDDSVTEFSSIVSPLHLHIERSRLGSLPEDLFQEIFGYLIEEYSTLRQVSKDFHRFFDHTVIRATWNNLPGCTMASLSDLGLDKAAVKLILLAHVLCSYVKPFLIRDNLDYHCDLDSDLRHNSVNFIKFLQASSKTQSLRLANALLKAEIILWSDVFDLLFFDNSKNSVSFALINYAWSLGLTTIAREMYSHNSDTFFASIDGIDEGVLFAIRGKHHGLSRFMINSSGSSDYYICYIFEIFDALVKSKFWDLSRQVYKQFKNKIRYYNWQDLARYGNVEALHELVDYAADFADNLLLLAAKFGHLEFLKEMDTLGFIQVSFFKKKIFILAVRESILHGHSDCFEFLIRLVENTSTFLPICLEDEDGLLPVHLAARSSILTTVLRLYPRYKPCLFYCTPISPLHIALNHEYFNNARLLLERFPELINFKDANGDSVIHVAAFKFDISMLELLLDLAPPKIISSRNSNGDTALHFAARFPKPEYVNLLMRTGYFTGMERNHNGKTPVYLFKMNHSYVSEHELMTMFNLHSAGQLSEALHISK